MPGFWPGVSAPSFPVVGPKTRLGEDLEAVTAAQGWYSIWTSKVLKVHRSEAAVFARVVLEKLCEREILTSVASTTRHVTYAVNPERIIARAIDKRELEELPVALNCNVCDATFNMAPDSVELFTGGPSLSARCTGTLRADKIPGN